MFKMAPSFEEYFPDGQAVQDTFPVCGLYLPAIHKTHAMPSGPDEPLLHVQSISLLLATGALERAGHKTHVSTVVAASVVEYRPAAQFKHAASPVTFLYLPATHKAHCCPLRPVYPALQKQSCIFTLPIAESEKLAQVVHAIEPDEALNVPAKQLEHISGFGKDNSFCVIMFIQLTFAAQLQGQAKHPP